jgi:3'-phosphoadenosine 5'-phosphosulfate synthase
MHSCFVIPLQVAAYDTVAKEMAFFDPSRSQDFLFISGTKVGSLVFATFII